MTWLGCNVAIWHLGKAVECLHALCSTQRVCSCISTAPRQDHLGRGCSVCACLFQFAMTLSVRYDLILHGCRILYINGCQILWSAYLSNLSASRMRRA